jgi:CheY-like chemotaxis protein
MIADDDYYSYLILERLISNKNGQVIYAKDGTDAVLHCLNKGSVTVALIDLLMPKLNGYETMALIKQNRPNIICIAQTAYGILSEEKKCLDAGFDNYILKPITSSNFYKIVHYCIQNGEELKSKQNMFISLNEK